MIYKHRQVGMGFHVYGASFLDTAGGIEYDENPWRFWQKSVNYLRRKRGLPIKYGRWVSLKDRQKQCNAKMGNILDTALILEGVREENGTFVKDNGQHL